MSGKTKAELEQELEKAQEYKEHVRTEIIEEANNQGLTCEVLDEFLERVDMEPRGENFVVTVPVNVRADTEEAAADLATRGVSDANRTMDLTGEGSIEVNYDGVTVDKAPS